MTIYQKLVRMSDEERAALLGTGLELACRLGRLPMMALEQQFAVLCPASLAETVFGREQLCEAEGRPPGLCRRCVRSFLLERWPEGPTGKGE